MYVCEDLSLFQLKWMLHLDPDNFFFAASSDCEKIEDQNMDLAAAKESSSSHRETSR